MVQSELGKLVRNSAKLQASQNHYGPNSHMAATRNLYNRQQPMQYAPSYNKRSNLGYGSADALAGFGSSPYLGASSSGRGRNSEANDDDEGDSSNFGPNFNSNLDGESNNNDGDEDGERSNANGEGQPMNLNSAASGYPGQGDYNNDAGFGAGFGFGGGSSNYGPMGGEGSDAFGPSDSYEGDGRRAKSASSLMGSRNFGSEDDGLGALQYGPNSAINSGERDPDDEGRAGYSPEGQGDGDNDDE